MHLESTKADTNHLLTVDRDGRVVFLAVHGDGELGCVREVLCSHFNVTTVDEDNPGVERALVICISWVWSENETSHDDDGVQNRGRIYIDK